MKYPYIGETALGSIVLFHKESSGKAIKHVARNHIDRVYTDWVEDQFKNITNEYLQNTYGEVQSPEHAEFIIELAENAGFTMNPKKKRGGSFFFASAKFGFGGKSFCSAGDMKKITIPLPPKQIQTATPEEESEMKQIMKNAGDNLVLGCDSQLPKSNVEAEMPIVKEYKGDEWPKIGDEVLVYSSTRRLAEIKGKVVKVIGKCFHSDGSTIITVEHSSLGVFAVAKESCIKPKTPEEELRDELFNCKKPNLDTLQAEDLSQWLIANYEITKKPQ